MKIKKDAIVQEFSDEYFYALSNGYLNPDEVLEVEDAKKVHAAVHVLKEFHKFLEDNDLIEAY